MLILNLRGGLGNQIIQIARAEAIDKDFRINTAVTCLNPLLDNYQHKVINSKLIERLGIFLRFIKSKFKGVRSDYIGIGIMDGYFQAGIGFNDFPDELLSRLVKKLNPESKSDLVIHFRGGDYLDEVNKKIFCYMGEDYYMSALKVIAQSNDLNLFNIKVVTNDIKQAKELFLNKLGLDFEISSSTEEDDFTSIYNSRYAIIPNSTFSLVARLLSVNAGINCKTVYPICWFTKESKMFGPSLDIFDKV